MVSFILHNIMWPTHFLGTYRVTLELNESAKRLKLTGMIYNLDITPEKITLIAADSGADRQNTMSPLDTAHFAHVLRTSSLS